MRRGAYPGSFNPPTVAHLAIAEAARRQLGLDRVDLVVSRDALGKHAEGLVPLADRLAVLEAVAASRAWLGVRVTDDRLVADIAQGYDAIVLGADKWSQVLDPAWYDGSASARDAALARLPDVALAPRAGHDHAVGPDEPPHPSIAVEVVVLDVHPDHHHVSATAVRGGRDEWMLPEAAAFADRHGVWGAPRPADADEHDGDEPGHGGPDAPG